MLSKVRNARDVPGTISGTPYTHNLAAGLSNPADVRAFAERKIVRFVVQGISIRLRFLKQAPHTRPIARVIEADGNAVDCLLVGRGLRSVVAVILIEHLMSPISSSSQEVFSVLGFFGRV